MSSPLLRDNLHFLELSYNHLYNVLECLSILHDLEVQLLNHDLNTAITSYFLKSRKFMMLDLPQNNLWDLFKDFGQLLKLECLNSCGIHSQIFRESFVPWPKVKHLYLLCGLLRNESKDSCLQGFSATIQHLGVLVKVDNSLEEKKQELYRTVSCSCFFTSLHSIIKTRLGTGKYNSCVNCSFVSEGVDAEANTGDVITVSDIEKLSTDDTDVNDFLSVKCFHRHEMSSGDSHISVGNVCAVIPRKNQSGHIHSDFEIKIIEDFDCHPSTITYQCQATPVVLMKPHGATFFSSNPAQIYLPLNVNLKDGDQMICLCSDTGMGERLEWKPLSPEDYAVCGSYVEIRACHFSFYTAVVSKGYPEARKMIYAGVGGTLEVPQVPGVEVIFPGSAVQYDIEATIKVMFADGPYDVDHDDPTSYALAAPVIKVGPTGHQFNTDSKEPVLVRLPLPHGKEILENCGRPYLTFWESTTAEGQPLEWKLFQAEYRIDVTEDCHSVCFPVRHFTFFRLLWSVLDSVIYEAKIGASFFYPHFEFYIMFQAFMSENEDDRTFGLCFLCYRMGNPLDNVGNYPIFVGSSGPRMVRSGLLQIRIVSKIFEANTDFGEVEHLTQQELFIGRPFDKQFACRYIVPNVPSHGTIGKVHIETKNDDETVQSLFDFLLTKPRRGQEMPQASRNCSNESEKHDESWEGQLSNELATLLSIKSDQDLGDDVWKDIARAIGYTSFEIDMKFKDEVDPLKKLLDDYKKRGGSSNDFITAMYRIGRKEYVNIYERRLKNALPEGERILEDDMVGQNGSTSPSRTSSSSGVILPSMPVNSRKRKHAEGNEGPVPVEKLVEVAQNVQGKWKGLGRVLGLDEVQIIEIERDNEKDGLQEQAYQMLLAWKERYPDNTYETLFKALGKIHLNGVARQLYLNQ